MELEKLDWTGMCGAAGYVMGEDLFEGLCGPGCHTVRCVAHGGAEMLQEHMDC